MYVYTCAICCVCVLIIVIPLLIVRCSNSS